MTKPRSKEFKIIRIVYLVFILIFLLSAAELYIHSCCKIEGKQVYGGIRGYSFVTLWIGIIPILISIILLYKDRIVKSAVAGIIGCVLIFIHFVVVVWMVNNPIYDCHLYELGLGFYLGVFSWIHFLCINIVLSIYREGKKAYQPKIIFGYIFVEIGVLIIILMTFLTISISSRFEIDYYLVSFWGFSFFVLYPILIGVAFIFGGLFLGGHKIKEKSNKIMIIIGSLFIGTSIIAMANLLITYIIIYGYIGGAMFIVYFGIHFIICNFSIFFVAFVRSNKNRIRRKKNRIRRKKNRIRIRNSCYNCGFELTPPFKVCPNCKAIQKKLWR